MRKIKENKVEFLTGTLIILAFVIVSYFLQTNLDFVEQNLNFGITGIILYILIVVFATVVAPVTAIPLLPLAVTLWGWFFAAIITIFAWFIGAIIAFLLARKYGVKLIEKLFSLEKIEYYQSFIPKKDIFLSIVIMRIFLPVDIFSYLLGLFSKVDLRTYALATFIGIIPFGFILAYVGSLPILYQILSLVVGSIIFLYLYYKIMKNKA